jgi:hypothetical protein
MPKEPPRDSEGNTLPHNHDEISNDDHVIRHIVPNDLCTDGAGGMRVSSGAYSESDEPHGGMSVDIEEWMSADGLPSLHYVRIESHGAVRIRVGDLRAAGFLVGWDPRTENRHHGAVWGLTNSRRRRKVMGLPKDTIRKALGET